MERPVLDESEPEYGPLTRDTGDGADLEALETAISASLEAEQKLAEASSGKKLVGAAKIAHDKKVAREGPKGLLPYPFHDGNVDEMAAIRMVKMVIPNCPADPRPTIVRKNGDEIPNPRYTGEPNCQMEYRIHNFGVWDVAKCESLGHDPWRTTFRKTVVEDVVDERPSLEDGSPNPDFGYVISERKRVKVEKRLNVIQVSDNSRHSTRTEIALALARGCKFMEDFGIESPCEFRNCSKKTTINTRYGKYCSERHARLVGADMRKIMLPEGGDPYSEDQALEEKEEILENIRIDRLGA